MKHFHLIFLSTICCTHLLIAQAGLEDLVKKVNLESIEHNKMVYTPSLSLENANKQQLIYTLKVADTKGKETVKTFELSASDIDKRFLKAETKNNLRSVQVVTKGNKNYIRATENEEIKGFVREFEIPAKDNDAAQAIIEALKSIIDLCEQNPGTCTKPTTWQEATESLKKLLGRVTIGEDVYEQKLALDPAISTMATLKSGVSLKGGKNNEYEYRFDFADMMDNKVAFAVSGKILKINIVSRNGKLVSVMENGKCASNENDVTLIAADIETAKCLDRTLEAVISLAQVEAEKRLPKPADLAAAQTLAKDHIQSFERCGIRYAAAFKGDCLADLQITATDDKGKAVESAYHFNFTDINERAIKTAVSGARVSVEADAKDNFVKLTKNGVFQGYTKEFTIPVPDGEQAKILTQALRKMAQTCPQKNAQTCAEGGVKAIACLIKQVVDVTIDNETMGQKAEQLSTDNPYKIKLTQISKDDKKSEEIIYEFSLKDMDLRRAEMKIKRKTVVIELPARNDEAVIKVFRQDKSEYVKKISIQAPDLEAGRALRETIQMIENN
jgi:hypothetical protein